MPLRTKNWNQLLSPIFVSSVIVLIINDFFLKIYFPGFITGKLSDFAGLFAFAFFWTAILGSRFGMLIYSLSAILFILWKSPLAIHFIHLWNVWAPYEIGRVEDYWDLTAIILLPFGYRYQKNLKIKEVFSSYRLILRKAIIVISLFAFFASAGGHGNMGIYKFDVSKSRMNAEIKKLYLSYPYLNPSPELRSLWINDESDNSMVQRMNADSVVFYFYYPGENLILKTGFVSSEADWNGDKCEIALIIYRRPHQKWEDNDSAPKKEKEKVISFFENKVLVHLSVPSSGKR